MKKLIGILGILVGILGVVGAARIAWAKMPISQIDLVYLAAGYSLWYGIVLNILIAILSTMTGIYFLRLKKRAK